MTTEKQSSPSLLSFIKREYKRHGGFYVRTSHNNHLQPLTDLDKLEVVDGNLIWRTRKGVYLINGWHFKNPQKERNPTAADKQKEVNDELEAKLKKEAVEKAIAEKRLQDKVNELKKLEEEIKAAKKPVEGGE